MRLYGSSGSRPPIRARRLAGTRHPSSRRATISFLRSSYGVSQAMAYLRTPMGSENVEKRPLGALHVASIVVGAIIGVGIFFTPATLASALPSPAWVLGIWLLGGLVSAAGALVFADLGSRLPHAGG